MPAYKPGYDPLSAYLEGKSLGQGRAKDGSVVSFRLVEDVASPNRGFVDDEISAWIDGKKVGFLIGSYIPSTLYKTYNPTIWNYANNWRGNLFVADPDLRDKPVAKETAPFPRPPINPDHLEPEKFRIFAKNAFWILCNNQYPEPKLLEKDEFYKFVRKRPEYKELVRAERDFCARNIDQPEVAFISTEPSKHKAVTSDNTGRGIGRLLYVAAAKAYASKGLSLRASTLQRAEPAHLWKCFVSAGWAEMVETRLRLLPERLPDLDDVHVNAADHAIIATD